MRFQSEYLPAFYHHEEYRLAISVALANREHATPPLRQPPTAKGKPMSSCAACGIGHAIENISILPASELQLRPARPRPAVWCTASRNTGLSSVSKRVIRSVFVDPVSCTTSTSNNIPNASRNAAI